MNVNFIFLYSADLNRHHVMMWIENKVINNTRYFMQITDLRFIQMLTTSNDRVQIYNNCLFLANQGVFDQFLPQDSYIAITILSSIMQTHQL